MISYHNTIYAYNKLTFDLFILACAIVSSGRGANVARDAHPYLVLDANSLLTISVEYASLAGTISKPVTVCDKPAIFRCSLHGEQSFL